MWNQAAEAAAAAAAATWGDGWDDPMGDGAAYMPYDTKPLNGHGHGHQGASGSNGAGVMRVTNENGMSNGYGRYEAVYDEPGFNAFVPYYQENVSNLANASYMQHAGQPGLEYGGSSGQLPPSAEPQVKWWVHKFDERAQSTGAYKLRSVGSMRPTNLGPTQPKGCRNKAREQRVKFQDQRLIPDVPRPLRPPCDIGLAMALAELEKSSAAGVGEVRQVAREGFEAVGEMRQGLGEVRQVVRESFDKAYSAVIVAARAHEELCKKTEQLKNNPDAVEKLKRAKICTRDVLLWRWFGLTAWIYNQAESEFFQSYGREIESQLMNSVAKIRQRLMQDLMLRPCWKKLEKKLMHCAATNSFTPELQGLLDRFRFIFDSLGGSRNPELQEFRVLEDTEKVLQEMAEEDEKQRKVEEEFAAEVWNHAGRKVSESVVGFLGLDDDDDDHMLPSVLPVLTEDEDPNTGTGAASSTDLPMPQGDAENQDGFDGLDGPLDGGQGGQGGQDLNLFTAWVCQQPQTPARVAEAV